uniref:Uncharacterized protein n=1 Tax=Amphimedon queenslandica TaxID=400682 RepID=A0A1X7VVG2_AMPQE
MTDQSQEHSHENGFSASSDEEGTSGVENPEDRTLTDHLNKKLLESFRNRLAEGTFTIPAPNQLSGERNNHHETEEDNDFEDS